MVIVVLIFVSAQGFAHADPDTNKPLEESTSTEKVISGTPESLKMKTNNHAATHFDTVAWRGAANAKFYNRDRLFACLVHEHPLIGMDGDELCDLIGSADSEGYEAHCFIWTLTSSFCGNMSKSVELKFGAGKKVIAYRYFEGFQSKLPPWITENEEPLKEQLSKPKLLK